MTNHDQDTRDMIAKILSDTGLDLLGFEPDNVELVDTPWGQVLQPVTAADNDNERETAGAALERIIEEFNDPEQFFGEDLPLGSELDFDDGDGDDLSGDSGNYYFQDCTVHIYN